MILFALRRSGKCLSGKYLGYMVNLKWECSDGHQWDAPPDRVFRGSWCPKCAKRKHFTEEKCRYILEQITGLDFPSNRIVLGGGFEIDLYNADLKVGIEYNGIQHYKFVKGWHKTLDGFYKSQKRDKIKSDRCKELGIDLHVVSYKESKSDENLVYVLKNIVIDCKIHLTIDNVDFRGFYKKLSSLSGLKKLAQNNGGKCLSKQYINCETDCKFECKKGHVFDMQPKHVKSGHWCRKCGHGRAGDKNRKLTLQNAQCAASARGGKCLSKTYKSSNLNMKWQCSEGHVWEAPFDYIRSNYWCRKCGHNRIGDKNRKLTLQDAQCAASARGGKCLSKTYKSSNLNMKWQCSEGHVWEVSFGHIRGGCWCKKCGYEASRKKQSSTLESVQSCAARRGGQCLSDAYVNSKTKLQFECAEGHQWLTRPASIKRGHWCPRCK